MNTEPQIILYADDDDDDRCLMREAVEKLGGEFQIIEASNGQQAIDKLNQLFQTGQRPCVIILDGNMPILNGSEAVEKISESKHWSGIPICIFSTSPKERFETLAARYPIEVYTKPSSVVAYMDTIEQLLSHCNR